MGKIKELLIKYKELVLYVVFGVLTTVVSYVSYWIFTDFLHIPYMVSTALSWVLSVTFAYVTNRKWVLDVYKRQSVSGSIRIRYVTAAMTSM